MTSSAGAAHAEEFLSGKLTQVDLVAIERELRQLWQSAADAEDARQHPSVSRACSLNLVLYTADADAETAAGSLIDDISLSHPCRAVLAIARPDETPDLEAWVSARCHLPAPGATKQICCEQITVRWEGDGVKQLPSVVLPLLTSDLPVFLWWRTNTLDEAAIKPFLPAVDRFIVDSQGWLDAFALFPALKQLIDTYRDCAVTDLSWRRIYAWREALASSFDSFVNDLTVSDLERLHTVTIELTEGAYAQAVLMAAWLASRLSWVPVECPAPAGSLFASFKTKTGMAAVRFVSASAPGLRGPSLTAVDLDMAGEGVRVEIQQADGRAALLVKAIANEAVLRAAHAPAPDLAEPALVGAELDHFFRDRVFEETLSMVARLCEARQGTTCAS